MQLKYGTLAVEKTKTISSSYRYPTKWGRYSIFSSCCDKEWAIIFTTGRLSALSPFLKLERVLTTANTAGTNGLTCLPKHGGVRDKKFWSPIILLTFEIVVWLARSHAERTDRWTTELLHRYINLFHPF
jgi:hypothetical protein